MRLLELYTSVQGEGPNVGRPTTFVRFAGCNMRCEGWPCDSPYAIYPEIWRHEMEAVTPSQIAQRVDGLYPSHVCITGGEPLLQPGEELLHLIQTLRSRGITIDIFTNGSRRIKLIKEAFPHGVHFIMDWKLTGSGEGESFLETRTRNLRFLTSTDAVKFVAKDTDDLEEAAKLIAKWGSTPYRKYIAPAWGFEPKEVIAFMEYEELHDVYLNIQVHKYIFDPGRRGI